MAEKITIFTIGHSTNTIKEFINLLKLNGITQVVDIRKVPRTKTSPQFNRETIQISLGEANIKYVNFEGLGGMREPNKSSLNVGWGDSSLRGYADHMQTKEFEINLQKLLELAKLEKVALMCIEILPWRCHRMLLADSLTVRGIRVEHIAPNKRMLHKVTSWAKINGTKISYPESKINLAHKYKNFR